MNIIFIEISYKVVMLTSIQVVYFKVGDDFGFKCVCVVLSGGFFKHTQLARCLFAFYNNLYHEKREKKGTAVHSVQSSGKHVHEKYTSLNPTRVCWGVPVFLISNSKH